MSTMKKVLIIGAIVVGLWLFLPSGEVDSEAQVVPSRCDIKDASGLIEKLQQRGASCATEAIWGAIGKDGGYKSIILASSQGSFQEATDPANLGAEQSAVTVYAAAPDTAYRVVVLDADGDELYASNFQGADVSIVRIDYPDATGAETLTIYQGSTPVFQGEYP